MKKRYKLLSMLLVFTTILFFTGCFGYAKRLPKDTYDKVRKVVFCVDGTQYSLAYKDSIDDCVVVIENMLDSGKIDVSNAFAQVKMPCDESTVEYIKESSEVWFEMWIENGTYKKLFFTINKSDTQTIWIYATATDSYDDGGFLEYYACDCKEIVDWATLYAKNIEGIEDTIKIEVTKFDIGEFVGKVLLTEDANVKPIVDNLSSLKVKKLNYNMPTAVEYALVFYGADDEVLEMLSITLDGWVGYHGSLHAVIVGELDITLLDGLFG